METPKSIYEFLEDSHFRKRPAMYLRGNRVLDLVKFIDGYCTCERLNNYDSGINEFLNKLTFPIREDMAKHHPEHKHSNYHWYQMIEVLANDEPDKEITIFLEHYDKFRYG